MRRIRRRRRGRMITRIRGLCCIRSTLKWQPRHAQRADRDLPVPYRDRERDKNKMKNEMIVMMMMMMMMVLSLPWFLNVPDPISQAFQNLLWHQVASMLQLDEVIPELIDLVWQETCRHSSMQYAHRRWDLGSWLINDRSQLHWNSSHTNC